MQNDFNAQFRRENEARIRRGLNPHADVAAYLVAQGFTAAEARARTGVTKAAMSEASSDAPPDAAEVYAEANKLHRASIYGADDMSGDDSAPADRMQTGRLAGVDSPADYLHHLEPAEPGVQTSQLDQPEADAECAAERRHFEQLAGDVYRGATNERYRNAIASAQASAQ